MSHVLQILMIHLGASLVWSDQFAYAGITHAEEHSRKGEHGRVGYGTHIE